MEIAFDEKEETVNPSMSSLMESTAIGPDKNSSQRRFMMSSLDYTGSNRSALPSQSYSPSSSVNDKNVNTAVMTPNTTAMSVTSWDELNSSHSNSESLSISYSSEGGVSDHTRASGGSYERKHRRNSTNSEGRSMKQHCEKNSVTTPRQIPGAFNTPSSLSSRILGRISSKPRNKNSSNKSTDAKNQEIDDATQKKSCLSTARSTGSKSGYCKNMFRSPPRLLSIRQEGNQYRSLEEPLTVTPHSQAQGPSFENVNIFTKTDNHSGEVDNDVDNHSNEDADSDNPLPDFNILIIGHISTGKSTLLNALLGGTFVPSSSTTHPVAVRHSKDHNHNNMGSINRFRIVTSPEHKSSRQTNLNTYSSTSMYHSNNDHLSLQQLVIMTPPEIHAEIHRGNIHNKFDNESKKVLSDEMDDEAMLPRVQQRVQQRTFHTFPTNHGDAIPCFLSNTMNNGDSKKDAPKLNLILTDVTTGVGFGAGAHFSIDNDATFKNIRDNWDTFDCVIVVMDPTQQVGGDDDNEDEQMKILRFVKDNSKLFNDNSSKTNSESCHTTVSKPVPVIVVCNKVDDPDNKELMELVHRIKRRVEDEFSGRSKDEDNRNKISEDDGNGDHPVVFLPMSALNAYVYRATYGVLQRRLEKFGSHNISRDDDDDYSRDDSCEQLDEFCMNKIGQDEVGSFAWKRLSDEERFEVIRKAVIGSAGTDDANCYKERLAFTNFDKLWKLLSFIITRQGVSGGEIEERATQQDVLLEQIQMEIRDMPPKKGFATRLSEIYDWSTRYNIHCTTISSSSTLSKPIWSQLKETCAKLFTECFRESFLAFNSNPKNIDRLYWPMEELQNHMFGLHRKLFLAGLAGSAQDEAFAKKRIVKSMKSLVQSQIKIIIEKRSYWEKNCSGDIGMRLLQERQAAFLKDPWKFRCPRGVVEEQRAQKQSGSWYNTRTGEVRKGVKEDRPEVNKYADHWYWDNQSIVWRSRYTSHQTKRGSMTRDQNPVLEDMKKELAMTWSNLFPRDWASIVSSILVMRYSRHFCENFSREIADLEWLHVSLLKEVGVGPGLVGSKRGSISSDSSSANSGVGRNRSIAAGICRIGQGRGKSQDQGQGQGQSLKVTDGIYGQDPGGASLLAPSHIQVPDSPADPSHWGHLAWMFCEFLELLERE